MKPKTIYLNLRSFYGVETVDEFTPGQDTPENIREFRKYVQEMVSNYHMAGMPVYTSTRCTNDWKNK